MRNLVSVLICSAYHVFPGYAILLRASIVLTAHEC